MTAIGKLEGFSCSNAGTNILSSTAECAALRNSSEFMFAAYARKREKRKEEPLVNTKRLNKRVLDRGSGHDA